MRIGIIGASGKTGSKVVAAARQNKNISSVESVDTRKKTDTLSFDILIDFSVKEALKDNLFLAQNRSCPIVIGTTGLGPEEKELIKEASKTIPVFWAPNFSLGMAAMLQISTLLSSALNDFTFHIRETHHKYKKDAPSGSALALKDALERTGKSPIIESFRVEEVIGEHTLFCNSEEETITLSHKALSGNIFAKGALKAAEFLLLQKPGLYQMNDLSKF